MVDAIDKILQPLRDLTIRRDEAGHLLIEDIWFERFPFAGQKSLETKLRKMPPDKIRGFIFNDLPTRTRTWLDKNRINYITESGYAAIHLATEVLLVRPDLRPAAARLLENMPTVLAGEAKPSRFINPTAFNIFDTLIRVPPYELANLNGLTFARSFGLSQSALSKIMSSAAARDLVALRKVIGRLGSRWWVGFHAGAPNRPRDDSSLPSGSRIFPRFLREKIGVCLLSKIHNLQKLLKFFGKMPYSIIVER